MPLEEIWLRLKECKRKCNYFRKHGHRHRKRHLTDQLQKAKARGDEKTEKRILEIVSRETQRSYWRRLNFATSKPKGRSVRVVSKENGDGGIIEYEGQLAVEKAIWGEIHNKRFYLEEQAPICKGSMRDVFGYLATALPARQVLAGTYSCPEDFDQAT